MRIEIFKAGTQTDSSGKSREWTEADLDSIASKYDPKNHEAPVCIGHPKDNAPAWGWVKSVTREGRSLFAELGDLHADFTEMLKQKLFKKRSISLYPDLSLRHIGFLGAQPPAVKGLADFAFSDSEAPMEYMDWDTSSGFNSLGRLFQGIRDWFIETKDAATADKFVPQWDIDYLKSMRPAPEKDPFAYTDPSTEETDMDKVKELETQVASFAESLAKETTKVTALEARATAAETRVAVLEKEKARGELVSFCDRMVNAGKMLPAQKAGALAVMESLQGQGEMEFTEGEGATAKVVKKSPLKVYQDTIESAAAQISFGEHAKKTNAAPTSEDDKLSTLTAQKMAANPGMNYSEASRAVLSENPDLNVAVDL